MNEMKKSVTFAATAVVLLLIALLSMPRVKVPELLEKEGELFFPEFTDPNTALSLEVIEFDSVTGSPIPFKVLFEEGKWTIPSENNYPADGKERLAKTAASMILIKRDELKSRSSEEYEQFGVIDPLLDDPAQLTGRGTLVTIKGNNDVALASLILGNDVDGKPGFRYVRARDEKEVYASKVDLEVSTAFTDWIEKDLLLLDTAKLEEILIRDYSVHEQTGSLNFRDSIQLTKAAGTWSMNRLRAKDTLNTTKLKSVIRALDDITIVGVRPKPEGVTAQLKSVAEGATRVSRDVMMSLQDKGFFFGTEGELFSNEGDLSITTKQGVVYLLRFGEVATSDKSDSKELNRYLFLSAEYDSTVVPAPPFPTDTSFIGKADSVLTETEKAHRDQYNVFTAWKKISDEGKAEAERLRRRFAPWYYLISSKSFDEISVTRKDLMR